jgi:hypothetical protein
MDELTKYLESLSKDNATIPIFLREHPTDPKALETGFFLKEDEIGNFLKEAPSGLYLGGGTVNVMTSEGVILTIYDNRTNEMRPLSGGRAHRKDGSLIEAAWRELQEECHFYARNGQVFNLPQLPEKDFESIILDSPEFESIHFRGVKFQEKGRAYEAVLLLKLRKSIDEFSVKCREDDTQIMSDNVVYGLKGGNIIAIFNRYTVQNLAAPLRLKEAWTPHSSLEESGE